MELIGPYELLGILARGGAGAVYRARETTTGRDVALKLLLSGSSSESQLVRFEREAQALAALRHPNIVTIHSVGTHRGTPYIVMDLIEGGTLQDLLREGPLDPARAAALIEDLARALHHAHAHGVLHRDVKPHNVLLGPRGDPLLTDFGLARAVDGERGPTRTGALLGTPGYMPPEQAFGSHPPGPPSDVYGLGATLYALLTGVPPHDAENMHTFLAVLATAEARPPRELAPRLDPKLQAICLRCLRKEPSDRYASAAALAEDLATWRAGSPPRAWIEVRGDRARRAGLAAALATLLLAGVAFAAWSRADPGSELEAPSAVVAGAPPPKPEPKPEPGEPRRRREKEGTTLADVVPDDVVPDTGLSPLLGEIELDGVAKAGPKKTTAELVDQVLASRGDQADMSGLMDLARKNMGTIQKHFEFEELCGKADKEMGRGDLEGAIATWKKALALSPRDADAISQRAEVYYRMGNLAACLADCERALQANPREPRALHFRAMIRMGRKEYSLAQQDLEECLDCPKDKDDEPDSARYLLARVRLAQGDRSGCMAGLDQVISQQKGRMPNPIVLKCHLLAEQGELARVEKGVTLGLRGREKSNSWLLGLRARVLRERGDLDAALQCTRRAVDRLPESLRSAHRLWFPLPPDVLAAFRAELEVLERALLDAAHPRAESLRGLRVAVDRRLGG